MLLCKTNVHKTKKIYRQITIQKRFVRAMCGEVLLDFKKKKNHEYMLYCTP